MLMVVMLQWFLFSSFLCVLFAFFIISICYLHNQKITIFVMDEGVYSIYIMHNVHILYVITYT